VREGDGEHREGVPSARVDARSRRRSHDGRADTFESSHRRVGHCHSQS
jgi:hypothetical protein